MVTKLDVALLEHTNNAEALVWAAMRQCYSDGYASELFEQARRALVEDALGYCESDFVAKMYAFIDSVIASGHESPIEHINFTFAVSGISRALSHQLVRHRIASYSQQSQRYVDAAGFMYIIPPHVAAIPEARDRFIQAMEEASHAYDDIQAILTEHGFKATANEDARFVLPNACETRIVFTMNARSLLHFLGLRCCKRAQWEIQAMARQCLALAKEAVPVLFTYAGAKCHRTGYCDEGARSCGGKPLLPTPPVKAVPGTLTDAEVEDAGKSFP